MSAKIQISGIVELENCRKVLNWQNYKIVGLYLSGPIDGLNMPWRLLYPNFGRPNKGLKVFRYAFWLFSLKRFSRLNIMSLPRLILTHFHPLTPYLCGSSSIANLSPYTLKLSILTLNPTLTPYKKSQWPFLWLVAWTNKFFGPHFELMRNTYQFNQ
jgi:hypothetical protein